MYFGCRHQREDYLYQEELEEAKKNSVLTQLHVAFSRDQDQKVRVLNLFQLQHWKTEIRSNKNIEKKLSVCSVLLKVYVQHLLKKNKENVWKLIHTDNAHIYVCG